MVIKMEGMETFIKNDNIFAVVGVSSNPEKWGFKVYKKLKNISSKVYPINPKYQSIENNICYKCLQDLPEKPDVVITLVPPKVTEKIVEECKNLNISKIWMQPGSESEESINFCKNNNINLIYNACFIVDGLVKRRN